MTVYVTDEMREWAEAFVISVQNVMEMRGEPITPEYVERITADIRAGFMQATRYDPSADIDPDIDPGHFDPQAADREAAREQWERMGGADRG